MGKGMIRRGLLATALAAGFGGALPAAAQTEWRPDRPVRMVVPGGAGSGADIVSRAYAAKLSEILRQNVVVENNASGGGTVGIVNVARARPDGLTVLSAVSGILLGPLIDSQLPYDVFRDFVPVSQYHFGQAVFVVGANQPPRTIQEFIEQARANPNRFDLGNFGHGSSSHLQGELLARRIGVALNQVPFQSSPPLVRDILGNHICCGILDTGSAREQLRQGGMRGLAVTGPNRSPVLPDLPTFTEIGLAGFEPVIWQGLFLPAGTPEPVVAAWSAATVQAGRTPEVQQVMRDIGFVPVAAPGVEFTTFMRAELARWQRIIDETGIRIR